MWEERRCEFEINYIQPGGRRTFKDDHFRPGVSLRSTISSLGGGGRSKMTIFAQPGGEGREDPIEAEPAVGWV